MIVYFLDHSHLFVFFSKICIIVYSGAVGSVDVWCSARRSCHGVGSNLARGKIFTASIGSVDSLCLLYVRVVLFYFVILSL